MTVGLKTAGETAGVGRTAGDANEHNGHQETQGTAGEPRTPQERPYHKCGRPDTVEKRDIKHENCEVSGPKV